MYSRIVSSFYYWQTSSLFNVTGAKINGRANIMRDTAADGLVYILGLGMHDLDMVQHRNK